MNPQEPLSRKQVRQIRLVTAFAIMLIAGGVVLLALVRRLPPPIRIMAGLGDVFMGCVLLVLVSQQRRGTSSAGRLGSKDSGGSG